MRGGQPHKCVGGPPIQRSTTYFEARNTHNLPHQKNSTQQYVSAARRYNRGASRAQEKSGTHVTRSVSATPRYGGKCDINLDLRTVDARTNRSGMDTSLVEAFTRNGPSGRWTITRGRIVAVTLTGLYFAGRRRVVAVTCRDPILVCIVLLESSSMIEGIKLPFPERGLELLSDYVGGEFTWEAQYLRPYASMVSDGDYGIGGPPIPVVEDSKPIDQFLTLKEQMEVALLMSNDAGMRCAGIGVIDECSPRGVWCRFLVPHSFFVVVTLTKVITECQGQAAYCEEESMTTLGAATNYKVL